MVNLELLTNKAIRFMYQRLGKELDNFSLPRTTEINIIAGAEESSVPPAIYHQKHLSRFLGTSEYDSLTAERERLFATVSYHSPVLMLPLKHCTFSKIGIFTKDYNQLLPRTKTGKMPPETAPVKTEYIRQATLVDADVSSKFFGHWLRDEMATAVIEPELPSVALQTPDYPHALGYLEMLKPNISYGFRGKVDTLNLVSDFSQGSHKQKRYQLLRKRLAKYGYPDTPYNGVFIARGVNGAKRSLSNEKALIEHLNKLNFDIIFPEKLAPKEIVKRLWNAKLVISVEGSAIAHSLLPMAKNAGVLVIQPPTRICHTYKQILDAKGHAYGFYVGKPTSQDCFEVDSFDDLDALIEKMTTATANNKLALAM